MRQILTIALIATLTLSLNVTGQAQSGMEMPKLDASPMDMAYFPQRYTFRSFGKTEEERNIEPVMRVIYSRPQKKDRDVFKDVVKMDEIWRVGANEATELMLYKGVKFAGKKLKPGRYTVYAVVKANEWEIHISDDLDRWGHYAFKPEESTVAKMSVPVEKTPDTVEAFTIMFDEVEDGAHMIMAWDEAMVRVPFVF